MLGGFSLNGIGKSPLVILNFRICDLFTWDYYLTS